MRDLIWDLKFTFRSFLKSPAFVLTAAVLKSNRFAITSQVFRKLGPETRKIFKQYTPPVVYIPTEERHQERPG
jgi:hypothetical protein